ncbi:MAG: amidohydrolase [Dehalococcoidia bacterium]|nr:amidohydrolase [Dehalococcoidia bacterium]
MDAPDADLVLYNAKILTLDATNPFAQLVAVRDRTIVHVGPHEDIQYFQGCRRTVDCGGKTVIPGFHDAHVHIMSHASRLVSVDCSPTSVKSIAEIQEKIRSHAQRLPSGTWIRAAGYNEFYLAERRHPTRHDLDLAAPHHPVRLTHRSLHASVLNSLALSRAGIGNETEEPPGALIERELDTGEPDGLLVGMETFLSESVVPPLTEAVLHEGLRLASEDFLRAGITSVQDATVSNGPEQWQTFQAIKLRGLFGPRLCMMTGSHALREMAASGLHPRAGDDDLRLGPVKLTLDEVSGRLNPSQAELNEDTLGAHRAGHQVAIHAVEENTVEAAARAIGYCLEKSPRTGHRHRIEHCSVCPPRLLEELESLGVVIVTQPAFIFYSGERYLKEVDPQSLPWLYRVRAFLDRGLAVAGSSDCPVVPCSPLAGVYAAVTRKAAGGDVLSGEEAVDVETALDLFTARAAFSVFEENVKGTIEPGKLADLAVLSADPTAVEQGLLKDIQVEMTVIDGRIAWERGGSGQGLNHDGAYNLEENDRHNGADIDSAQRGYDPAKRPQDRLR